MLKRDAEQVYLDMIRQISAGDIPLGKSRQKIEFRPGNHLWISHAGFTARRWVTYCDQYLKGGPAFERYLSSGKGTWRFDNDAGHTKGACLTSMTIERKRVVLKSRALLFAPTGVLDFKLANMVGNQLGLPVEWEVDQMNVTREFLVSVAHLLPKKKTPWLSKFWDLYERGRDTKFARHAAQYHDASKVKSETVIRDHFTFSIMRDFSYHYKGLIPGWKEHDRIFTRCLRPWRQDEGWVFNSHPPEMVKALSKHIQPVPSIKWIATERSKRLSKRNGASAQSKVKGYLNK